ncbi:MAG: sporulation protein YqfD [Coprobacillaceae bacterium]
MKLGYDFYTIECTNIVEVLQSFKEKSITLYRLKKTDEFIYEFYLPIYQRRLIKGYPVTLIKSIGVLHYMLLTVKSALNIVGCLAFFGTILVSSYFIWGVEIIGNNPTTNQKITEILNELHIDVGDKLRSYQELNEIYDTLKETLQQDIDYLNIYQSGSVLMVEYTNNKSASEKEISFQNLYAKKDGVIQKIEVSGGQILVKENQYVRAGELLVQNTITSTDGETKIIPVEGHIYAYTYQTLEASIEADKMDEGEGFSYLLFSIRSQLHAVDKIDSEKVLEYGIIDNKLVLKVQYILIEDIAEKGEVNEASN